MKGIVRDSQFICLLKKKKTRILTVEDETSAYENLVNILAKIDPDIQITGYTESVSQTVHWLKTSQMPDLILMDIHLSDGSAFSIFDRLKVETPIIFITACDEYAIEAFKVNSIDYLLNPVDFIRANKQYIISRSSVVSITIWFDSRLLVTLDIETPERIYVSKNKAAEFKAWKVSDKLS